MISRSRFLITAALLCHLLLAPRLVTSQLLSQNETQSSSAPPLPSAPSADSGEEITIKAIQQEKDGVIFKLRGQTEILYRTYHLYADEMTYNSDTGDAEAQGHVVLDGGPNDEHIVASHGTYNIHTEVGRFYDVNGTIGLRLHGARSVITSSSPFALSGKLVEKTGPDHYLVHDGTVTTCELPRPKWQFRAHKVDVDVAGDAKIYRSSFSLGGLPVFFFPYATYPVQRETRESGFMIPSFGNSSRKGLIFGESMYWAMNRSADITLGTEYYSIRGWAPHGEIRARPSESSYVDLNYQAMFDRGFGFPPVNQGGQDVRLNAEGSFGHNFRGVAQIDYLTSFVYRLAFNEVYSQAVYSEVKSQAFLSNTTRGFSYNLAAERYQNYESTNAGDVITILHAPTFDVSGVDRQIGHSPLYWSFDAAAEGLSRSEPGFSTAMLLGRFDINPAVSLPLLFKGWSFRPELSLRETAYSQQLVPNGGIGTTRNTPINRKALEGSVELRPPSLSRIFDREILGRKLKHVIEPSVTYNFVTGVDNFANILQFDERDILTNTNEVGYSLVNRVYAKRASGKQADCIPQGMSSLNIGGAPPPSGIPWERYVGPEGQPCTPGPAVREVLTWELKQKYFLDPTFGGALVSGVRNVFTTTADVTGIAFLTGSQHLSPLVSRLRVETTEHTDAEWDLDYDFKKGQITGSTAILNYYLGPFTLGGGDTFLRVFDELSSASITNPLVTQFHQFRLLFGYGRPNKRGFSGAGSLGFDAHIGFLQYGAIQTTYNWDCCGVSLEFRRFALGSVRNENQYRFNFTLANIANIGNLRRQERLF